MFQIVGRSVVAVLVASLISVSAFAEEASKPEAPPAPVKISKKKRSKSREAAAATNAATSAVRDSHEETPVQRSPGGEENRLTKNWGGARRTLSEKGIDIAILYRLEMNSNRSGGIRKKTTFLGNLDLRGSVDAEKLFGAKGLSFFVYGLENHGGHPTKDNVGDIQTVSNIETSNTAFRLYEAWVQKLFSEDKVSVLFGLHDLNSEFYVTDSSTLFFNSSFGVGKDISQTGENGPSIFPVTSPALRLRAEPSKDFYIQSAIFGARAGDPDKPHGTHPRFRTSDGFLLITEAAYLRGKLDDKRNPGKFGIGAWTYTRTFDSKFETNSGGEPVQKNNSGVYLLAEQSLTESSVVFMRYGYASPAANNVSVDWSGGFVFTGLIPTREKDRFGIAFARITRSQNAYDAIVAGGGVSDRHEMTYELNYRFEALKGITLQPSYQYVVNPGMDPALKNASVILTRLELSL